MLDGTWLQVLCAECIWCIGVGSSLLPYSFAVWCPHALRLCVRAVHHMCFYLMYLTKSDACGIFCVASGTAISSTDSGSAPLQQQPHCPTTPLPPVVVAAARAAEVALRPCAWWRLIGGALAGAVFVPEGCCLHRTPCLPHACVALPTYIPGKHVRLATEGCDKELELS